MTSVRDQSLDVSQALINDVSDSFERTAWLRILSRLRAEVGEDVFNSWFARMDLQDIRSNIAYLSVPTRFLKSWIESHYADKITAIFNLEMPEIVRVSIIERTTGRAGQLRPLVDGQIVLNAKDVPQDAYTNRRPPSSHPNANVMALNSLEAPRRGISPQIARPETDGSGLSGSPLDRRLTFQSFLVGRSNQLAHAAALRINDASVNSTRYNPLFIHSAVGLGKTHLLQAVAHAASDAGQRVIYLTAEKFMYGFVSALRAQTAIAFKEKLRAIDVLIIDDIQFLQGKQIQQEFCHTLNALIDAGRQIVVAADRPPTDLESLDERVRSRLSGGLSVEMEALDEQLRVKILESRIASARLSQPNFDVPPNVIDYLAKSIQTNGRDLEGAINRLLANNTLTGAPLTVQLAEIAISDLVRSREPKRAKIEDIQKLVATHYNVSRSDLLSARRTAAVVRPRQIAMYLSKVLTLRSLPEIGRRFGGRDHTTVLHAVRKIESLAAKDSSLAEVIELLKRILSE